MRHVLSDPSGAWSAQKRRAGAAAFLEIYGAYECLRCLRRMKRTEKKFRYLDRLPCCALVMAACAPNRCWKVIAVRHQQMPLHLRRRILKLILMVAPKDQVRYFLRHYAFNTGNSTIFAAG